MVKMQVRRVGAHTHVCNQKANGDMNGDRMCSLDPCPELFGEGGHGAHEHSRIPWVALPCDVHLCHPAKLVGVQWSEAEHAHTHPHKMHCFTTDELRVGMAYMSTPAYHGVLVRAVST
eukprot:1161090-Pelagomonas_calceolata.AAC.4